MYGQITAVMASYLVPKQLKMLMHNWSTQLNEAMNNSVTAYSPKVKNFSVTLSLKTRVGIASGVLVIGCFSFLSWIFKALSLTIDDVFASALKTRDKKKSQKRKKQKSNTGKFRRRKIDLEKYADSH